MLTVSDYVSQEESYNLFYNEYYTTNLRRTLLAAHMPPAITMPASPHHRLRKPAGWRSACRATPNKFQMHDKTLLEQIILNNVINAHKFEKQDLHPRIVGERTPMPWHPSRTNSAAKDMHTRPVRGTRQSLCIYLMNTVSITHFFYKCMIM
jgi:hypothetical protein